MLGTRIQLAASEYNATTCPDKDGKSNVVIFPENSKFKDTFLYGGIGLVLSLTFKPAKVVTEIFFLPTGLTVSCTSPVKQFL